MKIFFKRLGAFFVDCIILYFVLTIITPLIPTTIDVENLNNQSIEILEKYMNEEITDEKFVEDTNDISYKLSKGTYLSSIAGIVIYILYFVVYQSYNNGQTLGKKLFKIRVVKMDDTNPGINSLLKRCLIPYGILVNFILAVLILVASKNIYITTNTILAYIHVIVLFVSIITMMVKSRGLHDYLANTKIEEV